MGCCHRGVSLVLSWISSGERGFPYPNRRYSSGRQRSNPRVSQKRLAPESRVVLQQVVDVPDPVIFLPRTDTFRFPILHFIADGRPVDTWNRELRCVDSDRFSWVQNSGRLAIHRNTGRRSTFIPNLQKVHQTKNEILFEESHTRNVIEEEEGNTRGRKDKLRGQIGVRTIALNEGCTIGPPADSEYAVEPVGVETMRPSQTASVRCCPSTNTSIVFRCGLGPRWSETSFITCQPR